MNPLFRRGINSCEGRYAGSLDVRFLKACDNACAFCIEEDGIGDLGTNVEAMITSARSAPQTTVLILGGEPLLMLEKVISFCEGIRDVKKEIFLTTSLPHTLVRHPKETQKLLSLLDGLNVSLQHWDWVKNNEILAASNKFNRIELLRSLLQTSEEVRNKIRVSINLVRGGVDNAFDLDKCLQMLYEMGCVHVKLNELQNSPLFISFSELTNTKLGSPYATGCQTEIPYFDGKMKITLKRSCFLVEDSLDASIPDLLKIATEKLFPKKPSAGVPTWGVMYEDGSMPGHWLKKTTKATELIEPRSLVRRKPAQ